MLANCSVCMSHEATLVVYYLILAPILGVSSTMSSLCPFQTIAWQAIVE